MADPPFFNFRKFKEERQGLIENYCKEVTGHRSNPARRVIGKLEH